MADIKNPVTDNISNQEDPEIFGDDSDRIKTFSFSLDGNVTDVVYCDYRDKALVVITQFQKIGTLISVTKGCAKNLSGISDIYDIKTICGVDDQDYHLATRYLMEQLGIRKPILFGISLKDVSVKTLKSLVHVLKENLRL